jgi:hypothetical protein
MRLTTVSLIPLVLLTSPALSSPNRTPATSACLNPSSTPAPSNCAAASILASGIALNILDQRNEQSALSTYSTLLASATSTIRPAAFSSAKADLLTFVVNGIAIRQTNQLIAPPGNGATAGLAIVANAQLTELGLSSNLTGTKCVDEGIVKSLATDFAGGIMQNMENMAAVSCVP